MLKNTWLIVCLLCFTSIVAKKNNTQQKNQSTQHYLDTKVATANFNKIDITATNQEKEVRLHLLNSLPDLATVGTDVNLKYIKKSLTSTHYHYQQTCNGIPIYRSQILVSVNKKNQIISVISNAFTLSTTQVEKICDVQNKQTFKSRELAKAFLRNNNLKVETPEELVLFFENETTVQLAVKVNASSENSFANYFLNETGNLLFEEDLQRYHREHKHHHHHHHNSPVSTSGNTTTAAEGTPKSMMVPVHATVFMPDPVTTAGVYYGQNGNYRDNDDAVSEELTAELVEVEVDVLYENGTYKLESPYVKVADMSPPTIAPYVGTTVDFTFDRFDDAFEDVNAYYHIHNFQIYIQELGFDDLCNEQIYIDTHGQNGNDQSYYRYQNNRHEITFGEGHVPGKPNHVDDAEDADVVIHEYAHALSQSACFDCNSGLERNAIDEGFGDYLAGSYSRSLNSHNWQNVFSWDGHNEFWSGRNIASNNHYPEDVPDDTDEYITSAIWSSVLMEIWTDLGQEKTDKLVMESHYQFTGGIGLTTAAAILLIVEDELYNGDYHDIVHQHLLNRGLLENDVNAGEDMNLCLGDTVNLNGSAAAPSNALVYWSPGLTLADSTDLNTQAMPDETTEYRLNIYNPSTNTIIANDKVVVNVDYCFDATPTEIKLLNTDRFFKGRGNLIVEVPAETTSVSVRIFDVQGRKVKDINNSSDQRLEIEHNHWLPGIYLVHIKADEEEKVVKVGRVR